MAPESEMRTDTGGIGDERMDRAGPASGEAGVTLIEVLVAVIILAIGLLAVAGLAGAVATESRMAGSVTGQAAAGQEVLEELQMKGYSHADMDVGDKGTRQVTISSYTYTVNYEVFSAGTDLKEVVVEVEGTMKLPPDTMRTLVVRSDGPDPIP